MQVHSIDHSPCNTIEDFYFLFFYFLRNCNAIGLVQPKITILVRIKGQLILLQLSKTKIIQEFLCLLPLCTKGNKEGLSSPSNPSLKTYRERKGKNEVSDA